MGTNNLLTAADLEGKASGSRIVAPRGTIVTPGAYDYARAHSIEITIDNDVCPEEVGQRVVSSILREYEAATGVRPSRDEAISIVEAVVKRALSIPSDGSR